MATIFPILSASDPPFYAASGRCPACGNEFTKGFAYLYSGAMHLSADGRDSLNSDRDRAFLNVGFHGRDSDMRDSADVSVVSDLHGGQFDLQWCSIECMKEWFLGLLREVESRIGRISQGLDEQKADPAD